MKKKFLVVLLVLISALVCVFGISACSTKPSDNGGNEQGTVQTPPEEKPNTGHTHSWSQAYTEDGDRHYQTCDGCDEKNYSSHSYNSDGVCICGKVKPVEGHKHNYQWVDNGDGTHKQHCSVSGCTVPDINSGSHNYGTSGVCVCGKVKPVQTNYNVIFNANGGKIDGKDTKTVTGKINQTISRPNDPVRINYTFTGWYKDGATSILWNFDTDTVNGLTTLYAGWKMNVTEYDVTFVHNYAGSVNAVKSTENGYITYIPERSGYVFNGWWFSDGQIDDGNYILSEKFDTSKTVTQSGITLYAEWVEQRTNDAQLYSPSVSISEDGVFSWNAIDNAQGYKLEVYSGSSKKSEETLHTTSWTFPNGMAAGYYTVKIRANGDGEKTINSAYTEKYYSHHILARIEGMDFNVSTSILTWRAVKNATSYELRINDALKATISYTTYDLSDIDAGDYVVSVTPIREDYSSKAYTKSISKKRLKAPSVILVENNSACSYTISWTAVVNANTYRIKHHDTFINVSGTSYTIDNDSPIYDSNGVGEFTVCAYDSNADYFISGDSESFTVKKLYTLMLNRSDNSAGAVYSEQYNYKVGDHVVISADTNKGYTWIGWYNDEQKISDSVEYSFTMPNRNIAYTAKWTYYKLILHNETDGTLNNTVIVSFDLNGGSGIVENQIITETNGLVYPQIPTRNNYVFGGWYDSYDCTGEPFNFSLPVPANITLYAKWIPYSGDGVLQLNSSLSVSRTSSYSALYYAFVPLADGNITIYTKGSKYANGLLYDSSKNNELMRSNNFTSHSVINFSMTRNVYAGILYYIKVNSSYTAIDTTLYLTADLPVVGGIAEPLEGQKITANTLATITAIPTDPGQIFVGWYDGERELTKDLTYTFIMPSENVVYTAKFIYDSLYAQFEYTLTGNSLIITGVKDKSVTNLYISNGVTGIESSAFVGCDNLQFNEYDNALYLGNPNNPYLALIKAKSIDITACTIHSNTKIIADSAFYNCSSLTSITIPNSVTSIGDSAFYGCGSLTSMTLPFVGTIKNGTSNTHFGYIFGASLGSDNSSYVPSSLKTVVITSGTSIGAYAFYNCSSLTSVTIPNSVTNIGEYAFYNCSGLTSITIPNSVKSVGDRAFYNCSSLMSIEIPYSVTRIGDYVFDGCSKLTGIVVDSNNAYYSSQDGILYNEAKTQIIYVPRAITGAVSIAYGVTSIGDSAFSGRGNLTSIIISNSVTSIGKGAFWWCSSLKSITIPNSVTSIGDSAFRDCSRLTRITLPFVGAIKDGTSNTHFGYIFGASLGSDNSNYVPSSLKTVVITSGTSIGAYAFYNCSSLTSVTIPNNVTNIGEYAFYNCSGLTRITIPNSVKSIGSSAFYGCNSLQYNQYDNALYLGNENNKYLVVVKATSTAITSCVINSNTKFIHNSAFSDCSSLTSVTIPDSVTSIPSHMFYNCSSLTSIIIPSGVTSIGDSAFYNCIELISVTIPVSVNTIGRDSFFGCSKLTIYCEATNCPSSWYDDWNVYEYGGLYGSNKHCKVVWNS